MANFENVDDVGVWTFHSEITSAVLDRMTRNQEAVHQNKPRTCRQHESTWQLDSPSEYSAIIGSSAKGDSGEFFQISELEPEWTVLLFGVQVIDSDDFATGEADSSSSNLIFPTGAGIGPFLRPPIVVLSSSAFAIPDANNGDDWQTADLSAATDESGPADWLLTNLMQPFSGAGLDNFKAGLPFGHRLAGFDGQATSGPAAGTNYYVFWHALGPVAEFN